MSNPIWNIEARKRKREEKKNRPNRKTEEGNGREIIWEGDELHKRETLHEA